MKFWNGFRIFWIIYLLFFAIGLPLILHYAGNHHQSDYEMINTSASEAFVLLGVGTALWFIVFIYYIKKLLINLLLKKNGIIRLLERGEKRKGTILKKQMISEKNDMQLLQLKVSFHNFSNSVVSEEFEFEDSKPYQRRFEVGNTIGIVLDRELKPPYIGIEGQMVKWNTKTIVLTVIGLLLLIALAAGILVYTYINESRGYGWRYLYFWHPYLMIPGSFIFYSGLSFGITKGVFSKYFDKSVKPYMLLFGKRTEAVIESVNHTGLTLNDMPQILFNISFTDDMRRQRHASFKKTVGMVDLAKVQTGATISILYDPKQPENVDFFDK